MTLSLGASDFCASLENKLCFSMVVISLRQGDLLETFPTFSNPILNVNFHKYEGRSYFTQNMFIGPKLPFKLSQASMVTSPTGRGVVIIGGWNENSKKYSTSLFELDGRSMEWVKLKQKLGS